MLKWWIAMAAMLQLLFFSLPAHGAAGKERVQLAADEVRYDYEAKQIIGEGNVKITYKKIVIAADKVVIDQEQNVLLAIGNVHLVKDGDSFDAERFLYYLESEEGWLSPVNTTVTGDEIEEPVLYSAAEAFVHGEEILSKQSYMTSCHLETPHYHLTAKELEYYPDERIIMHGVWIWERNVPWFYLPYLYISLKEGDDNFEVEVGQNQTDGWYFLVAYNYFVNQRNTLKFKTKLTQFGNNEYGLGHIFKQEPNIKWYQEYAVIDKSNYGEPIDYKFAFNYQNTTDPKRNFETDLTTWQRNSSYMDSYLENELHLRFRGISPYPYLNFSLTDTGSNIGGGDVAITRRMDFNGSWDYSFDPTFRVNLYTGKAYTQNLYYNTVSLNQYFYRVAFAKSFQSWQNNLVYDYNSTRSYNFTELTSSNNAWKLPYVEDIGTTIQYTYMERQQYDSYLNTKGERLGVDLRKSVMLWKKNRLQLDNNTNLHYRYFQLDYLERDSEILGVEDGLSLTNYFNDYFRTSIEYGYTGVTGEATAYFGKSDEYILPGSYAKNNWAWNSPKLNASFSTAYNFEQAIASPANLSASWTPSPKNNVNFNTIYYWGEGLGSTNFTVNYHPWENWRIVLYLGYNFLDLVNPWTNKQFEAEVEQHLTKNLKVKAAAQYNMLRDEFSIGNTTFSYDWHCRELQFQYDWITQEFWFQVVIKAFPQATLKLNEDMNLLNELPY